MKRIDKIDFGAYCPSCGEAHTKACVDGGRCVYCMSSLATFDPSHTFMVKLRSREYVVKAESAVQVAAAVRAEGYADFTVEQQADAAVERTKDTGVHRTRRQQTMKRTRSYFARYRSTNGRTLIGGVLRGQTSRFEQREEAETRLQQVLELNGDRCKGEIVESPLHPEIFIHCGTLSQAIGGKCFGCGKPLTVADAKKKVGLR